MAKCLKQCNLGRNAKRNRHSVPYFSRTSIFPISLSLFISVRLSYSAILIQTKISSVKNEGYLSRRGMLTFYQIHLLRYCASWIKRDITRRLPCIYLACDAGKLWRHADGRIIELSCRNVNEANAAAMSCGF